MNDKTMTKAEIKTKAVELRAAGVKKAEVFRQLQNKGIKDARLAFMLVTRPDPELCRKYRGLLNALIGLMFLLVPLVFFATKGMSEEMGMDDAAFFIACFSALIQLLIAWAFLNNFGGVYNGFVFLVTYNLVNILIRFRIQDPSDLVTIFALPLVLIFFVIYVRSKVFPDLGFFGARKIDGQYQFADDVPASE